MRVPLTPGSTVVVAMSGGVDSSVAAALMLDQGYRVVGVTMKTYDFDGPAAASADATSCCGLGAVHDARMVAGTLNIPHYVLDLRKEFGESVIDPFVREYLLGRTPNPCILCNRDIKWGALLRKAESLGAAAIATGHYARIRYDADRGRSVVSRARYRTKDQSYALWAVTPDALDRTIFPLGELTKPEVRSIASRLGLRTADKEESFDICFVENDDYESFLKQQKPELGGTVAGGPLVKDEKVVGTHRGYPFYTIGQRRGLGAFGEPVYVTSIDAKSNTIHIGPDSDLWRSSLEASDVQWSGMEAPSDPLTVHAKVRYHDELEEAILTPVSHSSVRLDFAKPKRAVTPGQSVVFYDGDDLLGGGIIRQTPAS